MPTNAPARPKASAMPRPMPTPAPVTRAARPASEQVAASLVMIRHSTSEVTALAKSPAIHPTLHCLDELDTPLRLSAAMILLPADPPQDNDGPAGEPVVDKPQTHVC